MMATLATARWSPLGLNVPDDHRVPAADLPVCPWHGSRYDVRTGEMVDGPRGFLLYRGPTPGYSALVKAFGVTVKLRVRRALRRGDDVVVQDA